MGARRRPSGPVRSSGWWPRSAPTPCWPAPGAANLAAWVAVGGPGQRGARCCLTAELGLWGYQPTPADPYIFNQRVFPDHAVPLRRLGRARHGDRWPRHERPWAASARPRSTETGASTPPSSPAGDSWSAREGRTTWPAAPRPVSWSPWPGRSGCRERVAYVTSPGAPGAQRGHRQGHPAPAGRVAPRWQRCPPGTGRLEERVRAFVSSCGYEPDVARQVEELPAVTLDEVPGATGVRPREALLVVSRGDARREDNAVRRRANEHQGRAMGVKPYSYSDRHPGGDAAQTNDWGGYANETSGFRTLGGVVVTGAVLAREHRVRCPPPASGARSRPVARRV